MPHNRSSANAAPEDEFASEEALARRITYERDRRGWSPGGLAALMTKAGYPLNQSSVWKIENGQPRRKITVDEMIGFSKVFEIPIDELLRPAGAWVRDEIIAAVGVVVQILEDREAGHAPLVEGLERVLDSFEEFDFLGSEDARLTSLLTAALMRNAVLPNLSAETERATEIAEWTERFSASLDRLDDALRVPPGRRITSPVHAEEED